MIRRLIQICLDHPRAVSWGFVVITGCWGLALPSLKLQTNGRALFDPNHPALAVQRNVDRVYGVSDFTVVGLSEEAGPSIFTPEALNWILHFTRRVQGLNGVKADQIRSLATTPLVSSSGGRLRITPPIAGEVLSREEADAIASSVQNDPVFRGTLVSIHWRAAAVYVPMEQGCDRRLVLQQIETLANDELASIKGQSAQLRTYVLGPAAAESLLGEH